MPTGSGPVFGLGIDVIDQFTTPLIIGSPFHGRLDGAGDFQASFPPGSIAPGLTVDARSIAIKPDSSRELSDIVNITF